jgi:ABC-2 type transport system permease protein
MVRPSAWAAGVAVLRNELRIWFLSTTGWVFLAAWLFLAGLFFTVAIATTGEASLRPALPNLAVTLVFTLPLVTMRQLADEARAGTLELLLTAPVPLGALLVGKWAATLVLCGALLLATFPFPLVLALYGDPDLGVLAVGYAGLAACCAAFAAVGLFASATTRDPTVAGVVAVLILLPSWLASSAKDLAPPALAPILERASFVEHLHSFARGVLDTGDLAWFALVTATFLFLTWRLVESRRWR